MGAKLDHLKKVNYYLPLLIQENAYWHTFQIEFSQGFEVQLKKLFL